MDAMPLGFLVLLTGGLAGGALVSGAMLGQMLHEARRPTRWSDRGLRRTLAWCAWLLERRMSLSFAATAFLIGGYVIARWLHPFGFVLGLVGMFATAALFASHLVPAGWRSIQARRPYVPPDQNEELFGPGAVDRTLRLVAFAGLLFALCVLVLAAIWVLGKA